MLNIGILGKIPISDIGNEHTTGEIISYIHGILDIISSPFENTNLHFHIVGTDIFEQSIITYCIYNKIPFTLYITEREYKNIKNNSSILGKLRKPLNNKNNVQIIDDRRDSLTIIAERIDILLFGDMYKDKSIRNIIRRVFVNKKIVNIFDPFSFVDEDYLRNGEPEGFEFLTMFDFLLPRELQSYQ